MATYKEIKGVTVQTRDEDPVVNAGSWSSGGSLNTGRSEIGGGGSQTSGAAAGGRASGSEPTLTLDVFEQYNGTSWSEATEINTEKRGTQVAGTANTALLIWGGNVLIPSYTTQTESWNGSAWTEVNDLNSAKGPGFGGVGTTTAAIAAGSYPPTNSETWDGTSWTETTDLSNNREGCIGQGTTTSTSGFITGGSYDPVGYLTKTESWNGSAWTEIADLATAKVNAGGSGSNTAALVTGGAQTASPTYSATSEEFSFPPPTSSILTEGDIFLSGGTTLKGFGKAAGIPSATWSSGGSLNTARKAGSGGGRQTNAIAFAGISTAATNVAETYDGTSFTEVADLNTARRYIAGSGATGTAAIGFGGQTQPGPVVANTETWNGTSWTEVGDLNTGRRYLYGSGVQTSAILAGGLDGTSNVNLAETWDGSSWSEVAEINTTRRQHGAASANNSSAIIYGGYSTTRVANTEAWNGSSWSEVNDLSTARYDLMNAGSAISAFGAGGETTTVVTNTEEFTADDALSTVTVS